MITAYHKSHIIRAVFETLQVIKLGAPRVVFMHVKQQKVERHVCKNCCFKNRILWILRLCLKIDIYSTLVVWIHTQNSGGGVRFSVAWPSYVIITNLARNQYYLIFTVLLIRRQFWMYTIRPLVTMSESRWKLLEVNYCQ